MQARVGGAECRADCMQARVGGAECRADCRADWRAGWRIDWRAARRAGIDARLKPCLKQGQRPLRLGPAWTLLNNGPLWPEPACPSQRERPRPSHGSERGAIGAAGPPDGGGGERDGERLPGGKDARAAATSPVGHGDRGSHRRRIALEAPQERSQRPALQEAPSPLPPVRTTPAAKDVALTEAAGRHKATCLHDRPLGRLAWLRPLMMARDCNRPLMMARDCNRPLAIVLGR